MFAPPPYETSSTATGTNYSPTATSPTIYVVTLHAATTTWDAGVAYAEDGFGRTLERERRRVQGLPPRARVVAQTYTAPRSPVRQSGTRPRPHRVQHRAT